MPRVEPPTKCCASCGRAFAWRRRWRADWEAVRYCSRRCRERRPGPLDRRLERAILELLAQRPRRATLCPSEAARAVRPESWRPLMERARSAARRLAADGWVVIRQRGARVDPSAASGPIRVGRGSVWPPAAGRPLG